MTKMVAMNTDATEGAASMDESKNPSESHSHFAGRLPAGSAQPIVVAKNGPRQIRLLPSGERREILSVGLACSECFSGPRLARLLQPGFEYERRAMADMMAGTYASPLSIHTSSGVPAALSDFVDALEPHLPWKGGPEAGGEDDWCVSLQLEGASAVWAAVDMLLQVDILTTGNRHRKMVAVGARSYHGPPVTSFGGRSPLWNKAYQVKYPVPVAGVPIDKERLLEEFAAFLKKHGEEVGVLLIEPQWGSSQTALPWPEDLLRQYVAMAKSYGIRILCDEIMCGLGRHGRGTLFLSGALGLDPDAVTFGKAVAGGVFPLSGAVLRRGRSVLGLHGRSVMQSHTFSGSSARALMAGAEILRELPQWFSSIAKLGEEMGHIFRYLSIISEGMIVAQGQGLMWGCLFTVEGANVDETARAESVVCFKRHCEDVGVLPYFVPVGGFMVTPVIDVDVGTIYEIGEKLEQAIKRTLREREWKSPRLGAEEGGSDMLCKSSSMTALAAEPAKNGICSTQLHMTRSCTSCTNFVCRDLRMRFLHI